MKNEGHFIPMLLRFCRTFKTRGEALDILEAAHKKGCVHLGLEETHQCVKDENGNYKFNTYYEASGYLPEGISKIEQLLGVITNEVLILA